MKKMALWKKALIALSVVVGLLTLVLFGGGALIDGRMVLDTEKRIAASPEKIFARLDTAPGIAAWWSQAELLPGYPQMTVKKKSGPDQGRGLAVVFEAGGELLETWTIKEIEAAKIVYDIDFAGAMITERTLTLAPDGDGTKVTWHETATIEKPAFRWMKLIYPPEE